MGLTAIRPVPHPHPGCMMTFEAAHPEIEALTMDSSGGCQGMFFGSSGSSVHSSIFGVANANK